MSGMKKAYSSDFMWGFFLSLFSAKASAEAKRCDQSWGVFLKSSLLFSTIMKKTTKKQNTKPVSSTFHEIWWLDGTRGKEGPV